EYPTRQELVLALDTPSELQGLARRQELVMRRVDRARDLVNRPPNDLTPPELAAHARAIVLPHLQIEAFGRDWLEDNEMGAFAAVARGSAQEPQLIAMRYEPPGAPADLTLGLVGKAITFDSGGVSLKPALR